MSNVIMDPTGQTTVAHPESGAGASKPLNLMGGTLGLLDNGKPNSDRILEAIASEFQRSYGIKEIVRARKPSISRPASDETMADLNARCDLVIVATGD